MKASGVLPVGVGGGPDSVSIDMLDTSGKGADQFLEAIRWLDQAATQSVLAGFLDLTASAANGTGSYALSNDASSFYLQMLESKAREQVATYLGLDGEEVRDDFKKSFDAAAEEAKAAALAEGQNETGQEVAGVAGAVKAASDAAKAGLSPKQAFKEAHKEHVDTTSRQTKEGKAKEAVRTKIAKKALKAKTGGAPTELSNVDLAGFDPSQTRGAGGKWAAEEGEKKGKKAARVDLELEGSAEQRKRKLLADKARLTAEAARLRTMLETIGVAHGKAGVKHGEAGKHSGPKGATGKSPQGKTKSSGSNKGGGKHFDSGGGGHKSGGGESLVEQVNQLRDEVRDLKARLAKAQAKKARGGAHFAR
jgi:hypothetical protein